MEPNNAFCEECGALVNSAAIHVTSAGKCDCCGKENRPGYTFCRHCGTAPAFGVPLITYEQVQDIMYGGFNAVRSSKYRLFVGFIPRHDGMFCVSFHSCTHGGSNPANVRAATADILATLR
jgi:hypothetical protein